MMITDDYNVSSPILEAYSYYPFRLQQKGIESLDDSQFIHNKYLFNNITELEEAFDINLYALKYRSLDIQIGRFWQLDPLSPINNSISSYSLVVDNPVLFNDMLGLDTAIKEANPHVLESITVSDVQSNTPVFSPSVSTVPPNLMAKDNTSVYLNTIYNFPCPQQMSREEIIKSKLKMLKKQIGGEGKNVETMTAILREFLKKGSIEF